MHDPLTFTMNQNTVNLHATDEDGVHYVYDYILIIHELHPIISCFCALVTDVCVYGNSFHKRLWGVVIETLENENSFALISILRMKEFHHFANVRIVHLSRYAKLWQCWSVTFHARAAWCESQEYDTLCAIIPLIILVIFKFIYLL